VFGSEVSLLCFFSFSFSCCLSYFVRGECRGTVYLTVHFLFLLERYIPIVKAGQTYGYNVCFWLGCDCNRVYRVNLYVCSYSTPLLMTVLAVSAVSRVCRESVVLTKLLEHRLFVWRYVIKGVDVLHFGVCAYPLLGIRMY